MSVHPMCSRHDGSRTDVWSCDRKVGGKGDPFNVVSTQCMHMRDVIQCINCSAWFWNICAWNTGHHQHDKTSCSMLKPRRTHTSAARGKLGH